MNKLVTSFCRTPWGLMNTCIESLMISPSGRTQNTVMQASGDQDTAGDREKEGEVAVPAATT